jgi:hypothetical protein
MMHEHDPVSPPNTAVVDTPSAPMADAELARVKKLANLLDRGMLDPLIGFVLPGAGDLLGSLLGLYIVGIALRRKVSLVVVTRMLLNLAIDTGIGVVPVVGDIADIFFRANQMNVQLLIERGRTGGKATVRDWLILGGLAVAAAAAIGFSIYVVAALVHAVSR